MAFRKSVFLFNQKRDGGKYAAQMLDKLVAQLKAA
jgi:hypothetical protein